jgi:phosphoribosyl-dephospho-CoA transferase
MSTYSFSDCARIMPRAHDLLWVADTAGLSSDCPLPSWATPDWLAGAPLVVRRERVIDPDCIPVGLRGQTRSQRHKAYLSRQAVVKCVAPELLAAGQAWSGPHQLGAFPAIEALVSLAPSLTATGLPWGPTGSVGFALASGLLVLRAESDLDLVVRAFKPLTAKQTALLLALRSSSICKIDLQIDTGHGAFSLSEWVHGYRRVLLKTDVGPFLTDDPWCRSGWNPTESFSPS